MTQLWKSYFEHGIPNSRGRKMKPKLRLPYSQLSPKAYECLLEMNKILVTSSLGQVLVELIYLRVSQINGCAFCLEMHSKALREKGVSETKLDSLGGWFVSKRFDDRERTALAWADSVTNIASTQAPDDIFNALKLHFNETEISDLTFAIALMNAFNRLAISMRQ
jgi:AhpD family alkylhydroperoxidase